MMNNMIISNERGSVMSIALLFLILLTSLVMFISRSSTTDVQIAANERAAAIAFYAADAGAYGSAKVVGWTAGVVRKIQTGYLYTYAFSMIIGLLLMISWFVFMSPGAAQ